MIDAGRELDALVAEKVMGWTQDAYNCYVEPNGAVRLPDEVPPFSTDIAAAWQAADHMCERYDCTIEVKRMASFMPGMRYGALVCGGELAYKRSDITAYGNSDESPARALCLAMVGALP